MSTLTDYEQISLPMPFDLANGHADQEFPCGISYVLDELRDVWATGVSSDCDALERALRLSYASLIGSPTLAGIDRNLISPTASNSIDIVGAHLASRGIETLLLEPTFDNLALLLRRRGARVTPLAEEALTRAITEDSLDALFAQRPTAKALFIVNPNNPTGQTVDKRAFTLLCAACTRNGMTLIVDNSFRLFNRHLFDDYEVMTVSGVSYISFEDTGKCWPTMDLKLSMMFSSIDHHANLQDIFRELYLKPSAFSVALFLRIFDATNRVGIKNILWDLVDRRRSDLRGVLRGGPLMPITSPSWSPLPVEWLRTDGFLGGDIAICKELARSGLGVLPGRYFFWNSTETAPIDTHIRISLLKPTAKFTGGLDVIHRTLMRRHADVRCMHPASV